MRLAPTCAWRICPSHETCLLTVCSRFGGRVLWTFWFCEILVLLVSMIVFRFWIFRPLRVWEIFVTIGLRFQSYSCVPACMCVCVSAIQYVGTSVHACVRTYASRDEGLGSINNMVISHDSSSINTFSNIKFWEKRTQNFGLDIREWSKNKA